MSIIREFFFSGAARTIFETVLVIIAIRVAWTLRYGRE